MPTKLVEAQLFFRNYIILVLLNPSYVKTLKGNSRKECSIRAVLFCTIYLNISKLTSESDPKQKMLLEPRTECYNE